MLHYATIMPNTPSTSFRFSPELLKRLDRYAARLTRQSGVPRPVSRAAAAGASSSHGSPNDRIPAVREFLIRASLSSRPAGRGRPGASTRDPGQILPRFFQESGGSWKNRGECCGKRPFGDPPQLRADRRFACVVAGYWVSGFSSSNLCGDAT